MQHSRLTSTHGDPVSLERPSPRAAEIHLLSIRAALDAIHEGLTPHNGCIVWPAGLDRSTLYTLPLRIRTWNCLYRASLLKGINPLTVRQLLALPHFGRGSLEDLLLATEQFLNRCIRDEGTGSSFSDDPRAQTPEPSHTEDSPPNKAGVSAPTRPDTLSSLPRLDQEAAIPAITVALPQSPWERAGELLKPLLAAMGELYGTRTLSDALSPECMHLASKMGIASKLEDVSVDSIIGNTAGLAATIVNRLEQAIEDSTAHERIVIEGRFLRVPRQPLTEPARTIGVTRERVRQIQVKLERRMETAFGNEFTALSAALKDQLDHLVPENEMQSHLQSLLPERRGGAGDFLLNKLVASMEYTLEDGFFFDEHAMRVAREIRRAARKTADDVGLVDEKTLIASLPGDGWHSFWPWFRKCCKLSDLYGSTAVRSTAKARLKAAVIAFGRPASRAEIAATCGLEESRVGGLLSSIPSIVRADKDRWALKEWVDDEYEGIVAEIIQRITEDGGVTTTERILRELPEQFGVSAISVRAYMQTPKFMIQDGCISVASPSSVQLRHLEDVIDGRDPNGAPYWTFLVEERLFNGYSLTGVPPEFAKELGCEPDGSAVVQIATPVGCRDLSIRWSLSSPQGASLGYVSDPLKELGLRSGQRARVTIKGHALVEVSAQSSDMQESSTSQADAILARMKNRRRAL